jgi:hypothetical protein
MKALVVDKTKDCHGFLSGMAAYARSLHDT